MRPEAIDLHPASGTLDPACTIWRIDLDALQPDDADGAWLDADERARIQRLRFERDRSRQRSAHVAMRWLLGRLMDCPPAVLAWVRGPMGKPALAGRPGRPRLHFSLSHSGGWAVLAVSTAGEIGVDIERPRAMPELDQLVESHLDPVERRCWSDCPAGERDVAFLAHWTRKEAALKALGTGLDRAPSEVACGHPVRSVLWHAGAPTGRTVRVHPTWRDAQLVLSVARVLPETGSARGTLAA